MLNGRRKDSKSYAVCSAYKRQIHSSAQGVSAECQKMILTTTKLSNAKRVVVKAAQVEIELTKHN